MDRIIKIGYLCETKSTISPGYSRCSNGWYQTEIIDFHCYGLKTDCSNLQFIFQDYEQLLDLDRKYRPEDKQSSDRTYRKKSGTSIEKRFVSNSIVEELNKAFSEKYNVLFVEACDGDNLPYLFLEVVGCKEYQIIENNVTGVDYSVRLKIQNLDEQIRELQRQQKELLENKPFKRYVQRSRDAIKTIIGNYRIDANKIIPHFQIYPLDIAFLMKDKELLENLLRAGAYNYKHIHSKRVLSPLRIGSWYGFFKLWGRTAQYVDFHLLFNNMHLLPDDVIINIFSENNTCVLYEDITISVSFFKDIRDLIIRLHEKLSNQETEKDLYILFEQLILSKRYNVISVITDFLYKDEWYCNYDELLFLCCIKHRNLEALKIIHPAIFSDFFNNSEINEYYKENYLGFEMMNYIEAHVYK